jgi:hypothetical protein
LTAQAAAFNPFLNLIVKECAQPWRMIMVFDKNYQKPEQHAAHTNKSMDCNEHALTLMIFFAERAISI